MREQTWQIGPVDLRAAAMLADELHIGRLAAEILARRGLTDPAAAREFLHPDYRVHSPYLLDGMAEARKRVDRALGRGETIAVYGDYDADGITATFLLAEFLRAQMGAEVLWRLPNRFSEGYGISTEALDELAAAGAGLVITVDCGIGAHAEVEHARRLGLDVIVTDHHEPIGQLPDCIVINPKLGRYPFPHLAGVGVALKLAHALLEDRRDDRVELPLALRPYLDVVAVGTVADVVPLLDENRSLAAMGIGRLRSAPRPGLAALLEVSETRPDDVDAATIGFRLAPRLNAAGRLEDASQVVELLGAPDRAAALPLAQRLGALNAERQEIEAVILREALARLPDRLPAAVVLSSPDWHAGVIGIVAARVVEQTGRPTILLSETDGLAKGSGRSIAAFDLLAGVAACSDRLLGYGGHRAACGLSCAPPTSRASPRRSPATPASASAKTTFAASPEVEARRRRRRAHPGAHRRARPVRPPRPGQPAAAAAAARGRARRLPAHPQRAPPAVRRAPRRRHRAGRAVRLLGARPSSARGALRRAGRLRQERLQRHGPAPGPGQGRVRAGAPAGDLCETECAWAARSGSRATSSGRPSPKPSCPGPRGPTGRRRRSPRCAASGACSTAAAAPSGRGVARRRRREAARAGRRRRATAAVAQSRGLPRAARAVRLYLNDACAGAPRPAVCGDGGGDEPDVVMADTSWPPPTPSS